MFCKICRLMSFLLMTVLTHQLICEQDTYRCDSRKQFWFIFLAFRLYFKLNTLRPALLLFHSQPMPWLRRLVVGLSPWIVGSNTDQPKLNLCCIKQYLVRRFSKNLCFKPVNVISSQFHISKYFIYTQRTL